MMMMMMMMIMMMMMDEDEDEVDYIADTDTIDDYILILMALFLMFLQTDTAKYRDARTHLGRNNEEKLGVRS